MKNIRNINQDTNSYYTNEEYEFFTETLNFKWSNASNKSYEGHANCMYMSENGTDIDLEVRETGLCLKINIPTMFGEKHTSFYDVDFDTIKQELHITKPAGFYFLKFNGKFVLSIYLFLTYILSPILIPLYIKLYDGDKFKTLSLSQKVLFYFSKQTEKFSPFKKTYNFVLDELRVHIVILYAIILTASITKLFF